MKSISETMWDEWVFSPVSSTNADSEVAGVLWGLMPASPEFLTKERLVILSGRRLWVFRRLRRIWSHSRWGQRVELPTILNVPASFKGNVTLSIPQTLIAEVVVWGENAKRKMIGHGCGEYGEIAALYMCLKADITLPSASGSID